MDQNTLKRVEPLVVGSKKKLWVVITLESGIITRIQLTKRQPKNHVSEPNISERLIKVLKGASNDDLGIKYRICGTEFQQAVWAETCRIPCGSLATYGEIAEKIGCSSPRAVGQALGKNPLPLIIPCHRVIGAGGKLTGFSSGIEIKRMLLDFESKGREVSS
ncbi:MAG: methylated-DNA--[protein]-cysteine S-methyltransferase [Thermodesulfatator sp.]|nr:MAG: methylated-DNA--[protein]-cysteine S-methyltransferase [Thermodesulfatator sp.]